MPPPTGDTSSHPDYKEWVEETYRRLGKKFGTNIKELLKEGNKRLGLRVDPARSSAKLKAKLGEWERNLTDLG